MNTYWPFRIDDRHLWAYTNNFITPEECDNIVKYGKEHGLKKGKIGSGDKLQEEISYRDSNITWLFPNKETESLYRRMSDVVTGLNNQYFHFDIEGFGEGFQFTEYQAPAGKYGKHIDSIHKGMIRKLSISLQLSDPDEYEGGDLVLYDGDEPLKMQKAKGTLVMFPSFVMHEVTPVTKGTRHSLVAWITGPRFK